MPFPTTIPDDLRERDQWVLWPYEDRKGSPTKYPTSRDGGVPAVPIRALGVVSKQSELSGTGVELVHWPGLRIQQGRLVLRCRSGRRSRLRGSRKTLGTGDR